MQIDAATRRNLELVRTLSGERTASLAASIDRTVTGAGARLLAEHLAAPLTDPQTIAIAARRGAVLRRPTGAARSRARAAAPCPDIERRLDPAQPRTRRPARSRGIRDGLDAAQAIAAAAVIGWARAGPPQGVQAAMRALEHTCARRAARRGALAPNCRSWRATAGSSPRGLAPNSTNGASCATRAAA